MKLELGKRYRDTVTGFEGVATAETKWLNGCVRILLEPPFQAGTKIEDSSCYFDVERLVEAELPREPIPSGGKGGGGRKDDRRR